jgi:hypothetical protein
MNLDPIYHRKVDNVLRGLQSLEIDFRAALAHTRFLESVSDSFGNVPRAVLDQANAQIAEATALLGRQASLLRDLRDISTGNAARHLDELEAEKMRRIRMAVSNLREAVSELDATLRKFRGKAIEMVNEPGRYGDAATVVVVPEPLFTLLKLLAVVLKR